MRYEFRDLQPTYQPEPEETIREGFVFGGFDSRQYGLYLNDRSAPTPDEYEIVETIPYMQGVRDFSTLNGERFFQNREITFSMLKLAEPYQTRKGLEQDIKRQLMPLGNQALVDTHEPVHYWVGKCKSVSVTDSSDNNTLTVSVVFDCYPFAFTDHDEGADVWDDVYFNHWIWQKVSYSIATGAAQEVDLQNIGSRPIECTFDVTGSVTIKGDFGSMDLDSGATDKSSIVLKVGLNKISLTGNGTIAFKFRREELL
ncbi:hypothetical protein IV38_GL000116 [Lactobacillus selangorensis]|uniref:Phage tail protein n=1 Tax=Lactobacillus selangorensis TaxID=81857 RepID=A0A0R2FTL6_9LACO|nr:hypothetical protein [Lactobacillus selangorensis]KRN29236.1 hypothetical protein IV38_GL000116 [Lactobacillus selangorensis]KRN31406.1 hypothetical protein IV40_GL001402 [Lactobacillus selangorensis]